MNIQSRFRVVAAGLALALAVSACGTTEDAQPSTPAASSSASATASSAGSPAVSSAESSAASSMSAPAAGPITVTDGVGRKVELKGPATRVVVLEWGEAEVVMSLGVTPVGLADIAGFKTWDAAVPVDASVKDVGKRGEPSVDAIAALNPDLIIMSGARGADFADKMAGKVPVIATKGADATQQFDRIRADVTLIAQALGKTDEAEKLLAEMDSAIADGKATLAAAGAAGAPFLMADGWLEGSTVSIRVFTKGSLVSDTLEAIGLKNAWTKAGDGGWGLAQTDVEAMSAYTDPKLRLFYSASEDDVFATKLTENPIWGGLPFVKAKQLTKFSKGTWTFGGPASIMSIVKQAVAAYQK